jgi:long-chain acyl-CoA synthetase
MNRPAQKADSQMSDIARANLSQLIDYSSIRSIPEIWDLVKQRFLQTVALHDPHSQPEIKLTYTDLYQQIQQFLAGLQALGIEANPGEAVPNRVALEADNSPRWLIADPGIIMAGAANVVRGATADLEELLDIIQDSGCTALLVENLALLRKLQQHLNSVFRFRSETSFLATPIGKYSSTVFRLRSGGFGRQSISR